MSNVEYRCPFEIEVEDPATGEKTKVRGCSNRHFALPGGTRHRCRRHDLEYVQTEEQSDAPDFLNITEEGKTKSKDIVLPDGTRVGSESVPHAPAVVAAPEYAQVMWRDTYRSVTGLEPDLRWGVARLKDEVAEYTEKIRESMEPTTEPNEAESTGEGNEPEIQTTNGTDPEADPGIHGEVVDSIPE